MDNKYAEDEQRLLRIKEGDHVLFENLHGQYWASFSGLLRKEYQLTSDQISKFYIAAFGIFFENIVTEKLKAPLKSYLKTYVIGIGKNLVRKYFEKKKEKSFDDIEGIVPIYQNPEVDDLYDKRELGALIQKLLNQLDPRCRELIVLTYIEENSDEAIMNKMGFPSLEAVRNKRFHCMKELRGGL